MSSYEKGYTAAKANRDPSPPTTEPARSCYMDGYRDAERDPDLDPNEPDGYGYADRSANRLHG
mgnify:CR=1 FL=1